jgi:cobalt transporter subunit CbtB
MTTKTLTQSRVNTHFVSIASAVLAGVILVFFTGFAQATVFHDTAHDTRHAMAFPCH